MKRWIGIVVTSVAIGALTTPVSGFPMGDPRFFIVVTALNIASVMLWHALFPRVKE